MDNHEGDAGLHKTRLLKICFSGFSFLVLECLLLATGSTFLLHQKTTWLLHFLAVTAPVIILLADKIPTKLKVLFHLAAPALMCLTVEYLTYGTAFPLRPLCLALPYYYLVSLTVTMLAGRTWPAAFVTLLPPVILAVANYYVTAFRGIYLFPWDIVALGTALNVAGNYSFQLTDPVSLVAGMSFWLLVVPSFLSVKLPESVNLKKRLGAFALSALLLGSYFAYLNSDRIYSDLHLEPMQHKYFRMVALWYPERSFTAGFIMNLHLSKMEKPEGYSVGKVDEVTETLSSDAADDAAVRPNVIVIMNESYADLGLLKDLPTNKDYMPYYHTSDEIITGWAEVSIFAGLTNKSEFEFLTNSSMAFMPINANPYQQYITKPTVSLARQFDDMGYKTLAIHPYIPSGYRRDRAYPLFGFSEFLSEEDFPDAERIRDYVSDRGMYQTVMQYCAESEQPLFVFGVTMQNHGAYQELFDNFQPDVHIIGQEDNVEASTYLSLIRQSDLALQEMIEHFKTVDEPTLILMFGDHMPSIDYAAIGIDINSEVDLAHMEKRFTVPYVMWANFELADRPAPLTCLPYLSAAMLHDAGLPLTGYQKYLLDISKQYPTLTVNSYSDAAGNRYESADYGDEEALREYDYLQYNLLFDRNNTREDFFTLQ